MREQAAQQLLDAAKEILEYWEETAFCECDGECCCLVQLLRKAIARAEIPVGE